MSATEVIERRGGVTRGVFAPPWDEEGVLRNLAWHCLLVLDDEYLEHKRYPELWPLVPARRDKGNVSGRVAEHLSSLTEAMRLISPSVAERMRPISTSLAQFDLSRLVRGVIADLLRRDDQRSAAIRRQVRSLLEASLARFPTAYVWHTYESFSASMEKSAMLANLAISATHAQSVDELEAVRQAHAWAVDLLQREKFPRAEVKLPKVATTATPRSTRPESSLTRSQKQVFDRCLGLGELFYANASSGIEVRPRLHPLIASPTGTGKTHLVRLLAKHLDADLIRVQKSNFIVQGAAKLRPTAFKILDQLVQRPARRILLHIDELEKLRGDPATTIGSDWGASILGDLYDMLSGDFPTDNYISEEGQTRTKLSASELRALVDARVWIVGSGTFQAVFESAKKGAIGFSPSRTHAVGFEDLVAAKIVSRELLARFHTPVFYLQYAEPDEIAALFDRNGVAHLAREVGYQFTPEDFDIRGTGFRAIESLVTRLLLLRAQRKPQSQEGSLDAAAQRSSAAPLSLAR